MGGFGLQLLSYTLLIDRLYSISCGERPDVAEASEEMRGIYISGRKS